MYFINSSRIHKLSYEIIYEDEIDLVKVISKFNIVCEELLLNFSKLNYKTLKQFLHQNTLIYIYLYANMYVRLLRNQS